MDLESLNNSAWIFFLPPFSDLFLLWDGGRLGKALRGVVAQRSAKGGDNQLPRETCGRAWKGAWKRAWKRTRKWACHAASKGCVDAVQWVVASDTTLALTAAWSEAASPARLAWKLEQAWGERQANGVHSANQTALPKGETEDTKGREREARWLRPATGDDLHVWRRILETT